MAAEYADQYAKYNVEYYENESPRRASAAGDRRYAKTSPLDAARHGLPPTFQAVGASDPLVPSRQIHDLSLVLHEDGDPHVTHIIAGTSDHSTALEADIADPPSRETVEESAISYLRTVI